MSFMFTKFPWRTLLGGKNAQRVVGSSLFYISDFEKQKFEFYFFEGQLKTDN